MKLIDRLFRRNPVVIKKSLDAFTYHFGAPQEIAIDPLPPPEADEFVVRLWWPPSVLDKHHGNMVGTFNNLRYTTHAEARAAVLTGLRAYAVGDRGYCPVALMRVHWRGALRRLVDETQEQAP